jgi:Putative amidase domain
MFNRHSQQSRSARRFTVRLCTAVLAIACLASVGAVGAQADPTFGVMNAEGGIYWRSAPDWNTPEAVAGNGFYPGTVIEVHCYQAGAGNVPGSTDVMWEQATDVGGAGTGSGWVNEHFVNDGQPLNQPSPGIPACGSSSASPSPAPSPAPAAGTAPAPAPVPNAFYNRTAAAHWAEAHAKDPQPFGTMCTWFVSQALWAGGFPQSATWNSTGPYHYRDSLGVSTTVPGTQAAWLLPSFRSFFEPQFAVQKIDITKNLTTNAVPQAQIGDIILYDWGEGEGISHASIVVGIASGQYPVVSEMGQYDFGIVDSIVNKVKHVSSDYVKRGWTWSEVHQKWLQKEHPHMHAYLLHIVGGHT